MKATMPRRYYRGAHIAYLVYNVTSEESASGLADKAAEIGELARDGIVFVLVGNTSALSVAGKQAVSTEDGQKLAD